MVLDKLSNNLKNVLSKISNSMFVDEKLINEIVKEIQRALLQSDVNVKLVLTLTKKIKERALKENPPGLDKKEALIKIVYEELVTFLGEERKDINLEEKPTKIMMVGLFGSGKTTTSGKLAKYYSKRGKKVCMVGLDVWRPAAMKQLKQNAETVKVDYHIDLEEKDPVKIWNSFKDKEKDYDLVIVDTAGRDALSEDLIEEIELVTKAVAPQEKLLILSADIGQTAEKQASQFHESCGITGIIVTKMEGTAKGGGALTACAVTDAPIKFIGIGEKMDDIEIFNPQGFVSRILGMGDIEALLEKAQEAVSEEDAQDLTKKLMKGEFNLIDLYD
ncbi:signal recognition particle receptor subunit alpha, partial [Candidatus Woesearchaeota archaeon]|nr:signal recognition particle receptor subunit alpha [Candidatus Woesearchaeota archaeon]